MGAAARRNSKSGTTTSSRSGTAKQRYTSFKKKNDRLNNGVEESIKSLGQAAHKRRAAS